MSPEQIERKLSTIIFMNNIGFNIIIGDDEITILSNIVNKLSE